MNVAEIKGKELHFLNRVINRQQYNELFTLDSLVQSRHESEWSETFINTLKEKGLLRFENGCVYATDLAVRSINEKEKQERRLIADNIIDDYEYAFLLFMSNRDEPVHFFDFPPDFKYYSKVDGQAVPGTTNAFYTWMDEIQKYIDEPTIDGYVLNYTGKKRLEKLKREKELKTENEGLDVEIKKLTIANTRFTRNIAYFSLIVAALTAFVPLFTWLADRDKIEEVKTEIPQMKN